MDMVISSRPDHMSGMGSRNDEIVGVDRREIEFARMRSDMARAERQKDLVALSTGRLRLLSPYIYSF
jgi:hypothetical protein